jgi:molecular chaperone Hsp33
MPESAPLPSPQGLEVRSYFVRKRNALLTRADFGDLYVDYYLHLADNGIRHAPGPDQMLKDALAAVTLHSAGRPWNEVTAWTINFQEPLLNLFVTGDTPQGRVVGNLFDEDVKEGKTCLFMADVIRGDDAPRRSIVPFEDSDPLRAVETFYQQSEQRLARFFRFDEEDLVLLTAQPDCDEAWLRGLTDEAIRTLDKTEELSLLETRHYKWQCGCTQERILRLLAPTMRTDPEALFGSEELVRIGCPRCGARYAVTRETLEAFVARNPKA